MKREIKELWLGDEFKPAKATIKRGKIFKGGSKNPIVFHDYESYVAKFQDKEKTTDDTYTPKDIYEAVLDYVRSIYPMEGKEVLIVEDIIDSGRTLHYLIPVLQQRNPASIRLCALLSKPDRREAEVQIDYLGFEIPDEFVVGYGLDYAQKYRNLPYIGVVEPNQADDDGEADSEGKGETIE